MTALAIPTAAEITAHSRGSSKAQIEEAITHCNTSAKRCLRYDNLGRPNADWRRVHHYLDYLLTLWQNAA